VWQEPVNYSLAGFFISSCEQKQHVMIWELQEQTPTRRLYVQQQTNTECITTLIHTDQLGVDWWAFTDLFAIPYMRIAQAKAISDLFECGLTKQDVTKWIAEEKVLLKSNDPEKYEKLYKLTLEKEQLIATVIDPLKQHLTLCTIYVLTADERIDYFTTDIGAKKLQQWALDTNAQAFFLNWHAVHIQNYMKGLKQLSVIALNSQNLTDRVNSGVY
jgi:hypothetical protein